MLTLSPQGGDLDVLFLGAHPDDIEIGCGGTLLQLSSRPSTSIHGVVLTGSEERRAEAYVSFAAFAPAATIEVHDLPDSRLPSHWGKAKGILENVGHSRRPDIVFVPRADDAHQDHRLLGGLAPTVWRDALVLHYEIPKWDGDQRSPSHYIRLTDEQAGQKVRLLKSAFPSQMGRDWWDDEMFLGLMRIRGMESRCRYAEGFTVSKAVLDLISSGRAASTD